MTVTRTNADRKTIVPRPGCAVKGQIIAAGIRLADLAAEAGMAPSTLSDYLAGRNRCIYGQMSIMLAYADMTGEPQTMRGFWRTLVAREVA